MGNVLAIIPARGGSKRIPKKNIKLFLGKPIIGYSIKAAIESNLFEEVMVSTDDDEIALISKKLGANTPFLRSKNASTDNAPLREVILEVLDKYRGEGKEFKWICCILPAAPFITPEILDKTYKLIKETNYDALIPIVKYSYPIQRALKIENGFLEMIQKENLNITSQELMPAYHDCGQFYWLRVESFLKQKKIFMEKTLPFEISELEAQDIDNDVDWKIAELKYSLLKKI